MSGQFEEKMMNDDPEENIMGDEPKEENIMDDAPEENIMDADSGEMYPTLSVDCDVREIPLAISCDDGSPITGQPVIRALIDSDTRTILGTHIDVEGIDAEQA